MLAAFCSAFIDIFSVESWHYSVWSDSTFSLLLFPQKVVLIKCNVWDLLLVLNTWVLWFCVHTLHTRFWLCGYAKEACCFGMLVTNYLLTCCHICKNLKSQVVIPVLNCFGFSGVLILLFHCVCFWSYTIVEILLVFPKVIL